MEHEQDLDAAERGREDTAGVRLSSDVLGRPETRSEYRHEFASAHSGIRCERCSVGDGEDGWCCQTVDCVETQQTTVGGEQQ